MLSLVNSNTTLVKVKFETHNQVYNIQNIQIQLLLKLNFLFALFLNM